MNLIIFDIDGALTQTNEIDSTCFAQAIKDVRSMGIPGSYVKQAIAPLGKTLALTE